MPLRASWTTKPSPLVLGVFAAPKRSRWTVSGARDDAAASYAVSIGAGPQQ